MKTKKLFLAALCASCGFVVAGAGITYGVKAAGTSTSAYSLISSVNGTFEWRNY